MSDFLLKVKELNLPKGEFMVCGSGILDVLGIRKAQDIDLLVSNELFNDLKGRGWLENPKYKNSLEHPEGMSSAKLSLDFMEENYFLDEGLRLATHIEEIPFMSLEMLINAKTQMGREKDLKDIKLIEEHLEKNR